MKPGAMPALVPRGDPEGVRNLEGSLGGARGSQLVWKSHFWRPSYALYLPSHRLGQPASLLVIYLFIHIHCVPTMCLLWR